MSKILEKLAIHRMSPRVMSTGNFNEFQSTYRAGQSTETALLKIINDIITSACNQLMTVLLSLDLSAAFDTIDHGILFDRASQDFGIHATALSWLQSFVTGRKQYVAVGPAVCANKLHYRSSSGQCPWPAVVRHVHLTGR